MMTRIHNHGHFTKGMESPACPDPPDMARIMALLIMDGDADGPHLTEPRVEEGGDHGDDGDNNGVTMATDDGGYVVNEIDLKAVVDGVLEDLPEPAQHQIFPELEDGARPSLCDSAT